MHCNVPVSFPLLDTAKHRLLRKTPKRQLIKHSICLQLALEDLLQEQSEHLLRHGVCLLDQRLDLVVCIVLILGKHITQVQLFIHGLHTRNAGSIIASIVLLLSGAVGVDLSTHAIQKTTRRTIDLNLVPPALFAVRGWRATEPGQSASRTCCPGCQCRPFQWS